LPRSWGRGPALTPSAPCSTPTLPPDHVLGNCFFPSAQVISHDACRQLMARTGRQNLARAKRDTPALAEVELRLPDMTFQRQMHLRLGERHMRLIHTPGHSPDAIAVFALGDKVLVTGDTVMPVPYIAAGNADQMRRALRTLLALKPDFVVQGHGDVLLRGEVQETVDASIAYLDAIVARVTELVARDGSPEELAEIDIESCGLSRIPLDGLVSRLHQDNLQALYRQLRAPACVTASMPQDGVPLAHPLADSSSRTSRRSAQSSSAVSAACSANRARGSWPSKTLAEASSSQRALMSVRITPST